MLNVIENIMLQMNISSTIASPLTLLILIILSAFLAKISDLVITFIFKRAVLLKVITLELATTAAALWIQGKNRENASLLKDIPSGWRNSRLPRQRITFSYLDDEVTVHYKSNRDHSFNVNENTNAKIINWSERGIDIEINNSRFFKF